MAENPQALLNAHEIYPKSVLGSFICKPCDAEVKPSAIKRHMKASPHSLSEDEAVKECAAALKIHRTFPEISEMRLVYRGEMQSEYAVPPINGLPLLEVRRCLKCPVLMVSPKKLTEHMQTAHRVVKKVPEIRPSPVLSAQVLSKQRGSKMFQVQVAEHVSRDAVGIAKRLANFDSNGNLLSSEGAIPDDDRMHSPFIYSVKPHKILENADCT